MEEVDTMYHLMKEYNVKMPFDDERQHDSLVAKVEHMSCNCSLCQLRVQALVEAQGACSLVT